MPLFCCAFVHSQEYVENFRRQFVQIFPKRRELLLVPVNECGVRVRDGLAI